MDLALKDSDSRKNKVPVARIALIAGFVEIKNVHKRKGNRLPCGITSQRKGTNQLLTQYTAEESIKTENK